MPLFFFHYHTPDRVSLDDVGCRFESLEHAYADAYRSAVDLGAELLKAHCNPAAHRIDIADSRGLVLMELRFDEIFSRRRPPVSTLDLEQRIMFRNRMDRLYMLRDEMNEMCAVARENVAKAHEVLRRAKTHA